MTSKSSILQRILPSLAIAAAALWAGCGPPPVETKKSQNRTELAKDFLSRQDLTSCLREADRAVELNPRNAEAFEIRGLCQLLGALNNYRLLEVDSCLTGVDAEGLRIEMDQHLREADQSFEKATHIDGQYSEAFANRAKAHELLEEYDEAVSLNQRALEVPHRLLNLGLTRANLGWAMFHAGDDVGAAKELRQALQFNENMCVAKYRLGRVYFKREEWNKALEQFQAVVDTPDCPIQEAHLYFIRTMSKISSIEDSQTGTSEGSESARSDLGQAIDACVALAPNSCIAAQCQAGL